MKKVSKPNQSRLMSNLIEFEKKLKNRKPRRRTKQQIINDTIANLKNYAAEHKKGWAIPDNWVKNPDSPLMSFTEFKKMNNMKSNFVTKLPLRAYLSP